MKTVCTLTKGPQGLERATGVLLICKTMLLARQMGQELQNFCASQKGLE